MSSTTCTNPACRRPLHSDHVILVTTARVRHFCSVECIEPSRQAHERALRAAYRPGEGFDQFKTRVAQLESHGNP